MPTEPVPARVDAATKQGLLDLVDYAAGQGWPLSKTCAVLGLSNRRHRRWRRRQDSGNNLDDGQPGASPGALMPSEVEAIVKAFETFADKDFSLSRYLVGGPGSSGAGPAAVGMMSCPCP